MKLIYIANIRLPTEKAHGIQIMKMCEAFAREGAEVELLVPRRRNHLQDDPYVFFSVEKIFRITYVPSLDLIGIVPKFGYWIQALTFWFFARRYVSPTLFDLLYTRDAWAVFLARPAILEVHALPATVTFLHRRAWQRARALIVLTSCLQSALSGYGVSREKMLVCPDGVDIEQFKVQSSKFKIKELLNLPLDKKLVVYTGHLYSKGLFGWKGVHTLAEASQRVGGGIEVVFVGGTDADIEHFRKRTAGYTGLRAIGYQPHSRIPLYLMAADVLVLPNSAQSIFSRCYASPMKLFEYMASGTPIVASDLPSIREVLSERNAFLVKPDDPEALAQGIQWVLDHPAEAGLRAARAFQDVQQYDWQARAKRIANFMA